ncbi:MAG: TetR/AcrR family transcriptional regulator [Pseudomonadota bacterium]
MPDRDKSGRRGYHHGNLRAALIAATRALIAEKGVAGVTIADAARRAGVSPAAPYRHFQNREELLAETARVGFERFAERLAAAWNNGHPTALPAFEAVGRAYLSFAAEEPEYFSAMFDPSLADSDGTLGHETFEILRNACSALTASLPEERRAPPHMMALHIWALSHGVAALFAVPGGARRGPIPAEELLESGVGIYLRGIGLLSDP